MVYFNKKSSALASHVSLSSILVVHDRSSSLCTFSFLPVVPILQPEMGITVQIIGSWKFGNDLLPRKRETAIHSSTPLPHHSINKNMPHSCYAVLFHRAKKLAAFVASQFCLILSLKGKIIWRSIVVLSLPGQQPAPAKICFWPISQIGNTTIALWYPAKAGGPLLAGKENVREVYYSDLPDSTGSSVAATSRPLSIQ